LFSEKTIDSKIVFEGRVFRVEVHNVCLHDGRLASREIVRHTGGACVVALDDRQRVYLVRQFRKPFDDILLEIPAGKLEPGEDPLVCAGRELTEETGLTAQKIEWLTTIYPSPGFCSETLWVYLATGLSRGDACPDEGEHLTCEVYPLNAALKMIDRGEIRDAKTQVALLTLSRRLTSAQDGLRTEGS
jgi:ADP-ribose pyrophosphatase